MGKSISVGGAQNAEGRSEVAETPAATQAGAPAQPPAGRIKIWYTTWGSYGQHSVAVAILKDGTVIDPRKVPKPPYKMSMKRQLGGVELEIVNDSSRKNAHIYVYIPAEAVRAVLSFTRTSSGGKGWVIEHGDGDIEVAEEEEKEEEVRNGRRFLVTRKYLVYYYVDQLGKVPFSKEEGGVVEVPLDRPRVKLVYAVSTKKIYANGDTYEIRDTLKLLGFRWNSTAGRWERALESKDLLQSILDVLKTVADVAVEEGDSLASALAHLEAAYEELKKALAETGDAKLRSIVDDAYLLITRLQALERGGEK